MPRTIGLAALLGCATSPAPVEPPASAWWLAPDPDPDSERAAELDPCEGVELGEAVPTAREDVGRSEESARWMKVNAPTCASRSPHAESFDHRCSSHDAR